MHQERPAAHRPAHPPAHLPGVRLLTLGGLLVGFAVRLHHLGAESLWYDETVSVFLARLPLDAMVAHTAGDIHPPAYYALLHIWQSLTQPSVAHGLEYLFAWPSLLFGLLALPLLFVIARRLFGLRTAVATLWLAAFNPFLVWYSQEVRMYSLGAALGLLCLWALLQWQRSALERRPLSSWGWLAVYVLAAAAGLYTLYYFLFLIVAFNLIALAFVWLHENQAATRKTGPLLHWFIAQVALLLLWLPWLPTFWKQTTSPPVPPWRTTWDSPAAFLHSLAETLAAPLVGQTPPGAQTWPWAVIAALLVMGLALLVAIRASRQPTAAGRRRVLLHFAVVAIYVGAPTALLYAFTLLGTPIYHVRYLALFSPLFLLIPALLLVAAWKRTPWLGSALWAGLLVMSALSLLTFWTDPLYRSDDHRKAVAELAHNWRPGDAILANAGWIYPVLTTYWPLDPTSQAGSAPPPLQTLTRLLDETQIGAAAPLALPHLFRSGSVDGPDTLGWGNPAADFFAISANDTRYALGTISGFAKRIWHYRLYDTVSDPEGVIRQWLADNTTPLLDSPIPGRDYGRLQLFDTGLGAPAPPAAAPQATFGGALALLDATIPMTGAAGSYLYLDLLWQALPPLSTLPADLSTSLRIHDSSGRQVAQADAPVSLLPTRAWEPNTTTRQPAAIPVPANLGEGPYTLHLIAYRQDDAQPLLVDGTAEASWPLGEIYISPPEVRTISPFQFGLHSQARYTE